VLERNGRPRLGGPRVTSADNGVVPTPLIIDCDPGIDDMIALLVACASPEVELRGVCTVAGNVGLDVATGNALAVLELAGRPDVPVARGCARPMVRERRAHERPAHAADGLGGAVLPTPRAQPVAGHAVQFVAEALARSAEPVTLVAVGPLTNVALLYAAYPELAGRLARVVVMGGAIGAGNITPAAEFNVWSDPEAAYRVLTAAGLPTPVPTVLVGLDVTLRTLIGDQELERLRGSGPVGRLTALALAGYEHGVPGGVPVHDAVAVAEAIRPGLVTSEPAEVEVDYGPGPSRGNTLVRLAGAGGPDVSPVRVAVDADPAEVVRFVVERVERLDAR
jgi:pyrimidine-specific ribonucleoside hydrolase